MSVQIANCRLAVSRVEPTGYDTHGAPIPGGPGQPTAALPGKRTEGTDGSWQLALDPSLWPVRVHDFVLSDDGQVWLVLSCQLIRTPDVSDLPEHLAEQLDISFVRVTGAERTGAFTEPGGGEFVGR